MRRGFALLLTLLLGLLPSEAPARTLQLLHDFLAFNCCTLTQGVTLDGNGNVYGVVQAAGDYGKIFKIAADGSYTELHSFSSSDNGGYGHEPTDTPIIDVNGNLFGTTVSGGAYGHGILYKLASDRSYTVLHVFTEPDGGSPTGPLALDSIGNLYGTTYGYYDGSHFTQGIVFKISSDGSFSVLHRFGTYPDGYGPKWGVTLDKNGNIYGTTVVDSFGGGVVFKIATDGTYTVLHKFGSDGADGVHPSSPVKVDAAGNLYGTTAAGGLFDQSGSLNITEFYDPSRNGGGTLYRIAADGTYSILHNFSDTTGGAMPLGDLALDTKGNLYGATNAGGQAGYLYKTTPGGVFSKVFTFSVTKSNVGFPVGVTIDKRETLYSVAPHLVYVWDGNPKHVGKTYHPAVFKVSK